MPIQELETLEALTFPAYPKQQTIDRNVKTRYHVNGGDAHLREPSQNCPPMKSPLVSIDEAARDPRDGAPPKTFTGPNGLRPPIDFDGLSRPSV